MNRIGLLSFFICAFIHASAQYNETIRSARPGQSIGPFTTGARVFQIQSGVTFSGYEISGQSPADGKGLNVVSVFRFGLTEHFEVSSVLAYQADWRNENSHETNTNGISSVILRMRSNVYVGKGAIPSVGFQFNLALPVLSSDYDIQYAAPRITVMTNQKLARWFSITTNSGINWNGNDAVPLGFYMLYFGFNVTRKLSLFAEHYAWMNKTDWDGFADAGLAYLVNNDLQLDLHGGVAKNDEHFFNYFVSSGVSWRLRYKDKSDKNQR